MGSEEKVVTAGSEMQLVTGCDDDHHPHNHHDHHLNHYHPHNHYDHDDHHHDDNDDNGVDNQVCLVRDITKAPAFVFW